MQVGTIYYLPIDEFEGHSYLHLRLGPALNGQVAGCRIAADYLLGAVAQMGERSAGSRKVRGSIPLSSTPHPGEVVDVGAHHFRNRFGYYMDRAARGDEIFVRRRGRPYVRMLAAIGAASDQAPAADVGSA